MVKRPRMDDAKASFGKTAGDISKFARTTSAQFVGQVSDLKDSAVGSIENLTDKKTDEYEEAIAAYNGAFTLMSDKGVSLLLQRERSTDLIQLIEELVNSIANTPKSFEVDLAEIKFHRITFLEAEEFGLRDLEAARQSAYSSGAGFAAGAAVASVAPTAAMWVATTFGTASTGTAISTLSGAAASQSALAWLGGGALAAGGGGTAAGGTLLALAGPIGWTIAGATLLTSIALFAKKKFENHEARQEALKSVKQNTASVRLMDAQLGDLLQRTDSLRERLRNSYRQSVGLFNADFRALNAQEQSQLVALVNNTKACAALLSSRIDPEPAHDE
ncbi:hypothetical protein [Nesterenkonia sp. Act20]|uniref:hypothetical protein n=1 Tax=Nesterenkonia sp. Act20 TaxID=1483432 RepID=UPI001C45E731|nr:hypothetical protein [Nesterenkonia sp. Act20]